ncbi:MAG: ABC transporter permease [Verrucomicrobia bacterium]|nr:ABC transporter permease [Verrucomicrobiota bacterium]
MKLFIPKGTPAERIRDLGAEPPPREQQSTTRLLSDVGAWRAILLAGLAVTLAFVVTALPIMVSGRNPLLAYWALLRGAVGSVDAVAFAFNKSTPYVLSAVGVAICFRARVINIGSEGQLAVGGVAASWIALHLSQWPSFLLIPVSLVAGGVAGAVWACIAAVMRIKRGVHEVLGTLMLNFVGTLVVSEVLHGAMGEPGAGFPQSPLFPQSAWLPSLFPGTDMHVGIAIAIAAVVASHILFWHTPFGFRLRLLGSGDNVAAYAGASLVRGMLQVMLIAGGLAGIAGAIEVLGVHYRLIEGFSQGFGFNAVAIALLAALNPLAVLPAGLFFGFLEAGALAMQREIGVPSSLVFVIQGLTMIFVLCAMGVGIKQQRI